MVNVKLHRMISEGEHQEQDFKFCINDSRKIARSLVAFANTDGGRLLIGVKDNGNVAGVRSDEEYYMVEAAAKLYSKPIINFETRQWHSEGKTVLEIFIPQSEERPHYAKDDTGKWLAYIRKEDENILASRILLEVWKRKKSPRGAFIRFSDDDRLLLNILNDTPILSLSKYARQARIPRRKAERILINLISVGVINLDTTNEGVRFRLVDDFSIETFEANFK